MKTQTDKYKGKGGFRKIDTPKSEKRCNHPEHNPPGYIVLKPGVYEYTCPSCGEITATLTVPDITC